MGKSLVSKVTLVFCITLMSMMSISICKAEEQTNIDERIINVTDIELEGYEDELMVGETMKLTSTVIPEDATDTRVAYKSSNTKIATVKSNGTVTGVASGNVIIYVTGGSITKELPITVKVKTKAINVNKEYVVMQAGKQFELDAKVVPDSADSKLTYKSTNTDVATVSADGIINAKSCGSTTIIVSNGYMQIQVTVVVNEDYFNSDNLTDDMDAVNSAIAYPDVVYTSEYPVITSEMLKYYYENKKNLTITGTNYKIYTNWSDIVNFENELKTILDIDETNDGIMLDLSDRLCGKVTIDMSDVVLNEKYLYLYNNDSNKYQQIKVDNIKQLTIDTPGKYLITDEHLEDRKSSLLFIVFGGVVIVAGVIAYVALKKRYWFW